MEIKKTMENGILQMCIEGRIDTMTAPKLAEEIDAVSADVKNLVFDFGGVEYISSAGLRVILTAQKMMNVRGSLVIKNVNEIVMEIFEITGFVDILNIE